MSLDKIYVLKKILKEALQIQEWQLDIFTSLHNIDASWIVSGTIDPDRILWESVNHNLIPTDDNTYSLGSSTYRWKDLYAVTVHQGDAVFSNGWRISEGEKYGVDSPLVLVSPDGEVYKFNIEKVGR